MTYLLYFVILIGFCILIPRIPFLKKSGIKAEWLIALFLIRAFAGFINCYLSYHYFTVSDSMAFHIIGLNEYHHLTTNPKYFFSETFNDYGNNYSGFFEISHSFWNNLKGNVIVKTIALLDLFTFRNFYINTLIFNIPVFFGTVALYRALKDLSGRTGKLLLAGIFLFPSGLFYTSAIHRDGLVWMCTGFIVFAVHSIFVKGFSLKKFSFSLISFLLIFSIRNYLALTIVPALAAWWISVKNEKYSAAIFSMVALLCILLFFSGRNIFPSADFPRIIVNRLAAFDEIAKDSRTYLPMPLLTPDLTGFLRLLPTALVHAVFMPLPWQVTTVTEIPFAIELLLMEALFVYYLIRKRTYSSRPAIYFILFVSVISLLIIGYTVPNLGAIIRYRSIYLQLLFILLAYSFKTKA